MAAPDSLASIVFEGLAEEDRVFVFPSQVAADAWAVEALLRSGRKAVDPDRFLGWDRFKEGNLSRRNEASPANRVTRTIWAAGVVARQERDHALRSILGPGTPSPSFVGFLAKIPPSLAGIARSIRAQSEGTTDGGRLRDDPTMLDLLDLHDDYAAFIAERGLFQPAWESLRFEPGQRRHLIIFPELMEDFAEYREDLEGESSITILPLLGTPEAPAVLGFENLHEELRHVFLDIGALLDSGLPPEEIGVTVSDLDAARPWIEAAARVAGVPIVVRRGKPLSSAPFGRLLGEVGRAAATGFGLPAMEALLLDRFVTWKEAGSAAGLVRFGFDKHAFASYTKEGRSVDIWEESFRVCGVQRSLVSFYRRLRAAIFAVSGASSFAALKSSIMVFRNQFIDESNWLAGDDRTVERAMEELDSLVRAEAAYAGDEAIPSPYALLMSTLDSEGYVPQERGGRVQIYPWRVSALLPFKVHFLVGCGQDQVRVSYGTEAFLREDQKAELGRQPRDATEDFLKAYLLSGPKIVPCHADEGIGGWTAPHPFFPLGEGSRDRPDRAALDGLGPLSSERSAWKMAGALPARLLVAQKRAFERVLAIDRAGRRKFGPIEGRALGRILERASGKDGLLRLSYTLIDEYRACPFRWLQGRVLAVGEAEYELEFFDARLAGEMAHRAIERLFEGISRLGLIESRHLDEYRDLARSAPLAILPGFSEQKGPFLVPMFEAWAPLLSDRLERLVEAVVAEGGWEVGDFGSR
ncbi:MAG: hypothetical protein WCL50_10040 [Spirochaetota bacterium]